MTPNARLMCRLGLQGDGRRAYQRQGIGCTAFVHCGQEHQRGNRHTKVDGGQVQPVIVPADFERLGIALGVAVGSRGYVLSIYAKPAGVGVGVG